MPRRNPLTAALVTGPAHGTLTLRTQRRLHLHAHGQLQRRRQLHLPGQRWDRDSNVGTVSLTIAPVNDAPVAVADSANGNQGTTITGNVLTNDTDVDAGTTLTAAVATGPANGTLTLDANGSFTYTPNAAFSGSDSFTYRANDGTADSNTATVSLTVTAVAGQTLTGTNQANTLTGGVGADTINGLSGDDTLSGLTGADLIDGGTGNDRISGGLGADIPDRRKRQWRRHLCI